MQYDTSIYVRLTSSRVWERLRPLSHCEINSDCGKRPFPFDGDFLNRLINVSAKSGYIFDCSYTEEELNEIVTRLAEAIGKEGVVLTKTTNYNVDGYVHAVFYLGDRVRNLQILEEEDKSHYNRLWDADLTNIAEWLTEAEVSASQKELDHLWRFGIFGSRDADKMIFAHLADCPSLSNPVLLRETSSDEHAARIEKIFPDDILTLRRARDKYNPRKVELVHALGTIGSLPSDIGDIVYAQIGNKRFSLGAKVVSVVPRSRRNAHARSALVAIQIQILSETS